MTSVRCVTSLSAFDLDGVEKLRTSYRVMVKVAKLFPATKRMAAFPAAVLTAYHCPVHASNLRKRSPQPTDIAEAARKRDRLTADSALWIHDVVRQRAPRR
jgi:hypothetical protein